MKCEGDDIVDQQLEQISKLKDQMLARGYHHAQLNNIVKEVIGTTSLDVISVEQSTGLLETLEYYSEFANKCLKMKL